MWIQSLYIWIHIMNSYKSEFMYEFRIFTYIFMCMNSLLIYSWIHMIISYMNSYRLWIHMIISCLNSYYSMVVLMIQYEFIYMNPGLISCNIWIHMIISYMNSRGSRIHIWIWRYQLTTKFPHDMDNMKKYALPNLAASIAQRLFQG